MAHLCLCRFAASLRVRCTAGLQNGRLYARAISLRDSCFASRCSQIKTLVSSHHEFRTCSVPAASVVRSTVPVGLPHLTYRAYSTKKYGSVIRSRIHSMLFVLHLWRVNRRIFNLISATSLVADLRVEHVTFKFYIMNFFL